MKTKVVHSQSKDAWNVVGDSTGDKYKIARVPYHVHKFDQGLTNSTCQEALDHAIFISHSFNRGDVVVELPHPDKVAGKRFDLRKPYSYEITIVSPSIEIID